MQQKYGVAAMFHKVIVTTTYIPAYFEEQVRSLQKVNVFLGNRIADDGEPVIQLVRIAWLPDVCLGDNCDSHSCLSVGISAFLLGEWIWSIPGTGKMDFWVISSNFLQPRATT